MKSKDILTANAAEFSEIGEGVLTDRIKKRANAETDCVVSEPSFEAPNEWSKEDVAEALSSKTISPKIVGGVTSLIDAVMVAGSGLASLALSGAALNNAPIETTLIAAVTALFILVSHALRLDSVQILRHVNQQFLRLSGTWITCFCVIMFFSQLFPSLNLFNPTWVTPWFLVGFVGLASARFLVHAKVRAWSNAGRLERRAIIVGGGKEAEEVIRGLERQSDNDIRICGIFDDRTDDRSPDIVAGYPKLGTTPELLEFARSAKVDMLIVSLPLTAGGRVREMLKSLWVLPVDIRLSAHSNKLAFKQRAYSYVGAMPFVRLADRPIAGWRFVQKRIFDVVISTLMIIGLSPLMLATAIAIKWDSRGPVFFRQKRHGFNNEEIEVWKFRSMYTDMCDAKAKVVVTKNDPRVTRVGAFIRKTSIDELPQLWNVLKGELSLVGPRPHAVHAHLEEQPWNEVVDGYFARHRVKPGVTGWAQINGWRGEIDTVEKIKKRTDYDLYYIENWSLAFDFYIVAMTPVRLLNTENAY